MDAVPDLPLGEVGKESPDARDATAAYIKTVNADPKPFRWTKSADDILAAVHRFCPRTLDTGRSQIEPTSK